MRFKRVNRGQVAKSVTVPAPIGGLNGRDALAAMDASDAFVLDNIFPGTATVGSRNGFVEFCSGLGLAIRTLAPFTSGSAPQLLAFGGDDIWEISTGVAVQLTFNDRLSNICSTTMFSNAGGQRMVIVNGVQTPCMYDGAAITDLVMTVITQPADLIFVYTWKGRLYFAEKEMLGFWYLPVNAIQGAMAYFDLTQVAKNGGYLLAIASISMDAGSGPDDYILFVTSVGEYILYGGYDPSNTANFSLIGRFYSAAPVSRNCTFNYNGDLVILTLAGAIPFSEIRRDGGYDADKDAVTSKLGSYLSDLNAFSASHGWQVSLYPKGKMLILNVPLGALPADGFTQFVQNILTKAWGKFTGIPGTSWCLFNDSIYFGHETTGKVYLFDSGTTDNGAQIQIQCKQAWNYFADSWGGGELNKHWHFAKMLINWNGVNDPPLTAALNADFVESDPAYVADSGGAATAATKFITFSFDKLGVASSLSIRAQISGHSLKWYATQYIFNKVKGVL